MLLTFVLAACDLASGTKKVTFDTQSGSAVATQIVVYGEKAVVPKDPVKAGYEFKGWSENKVDYDEFDFNTAITEDITLYAFWDEVDAEAVFNAAIENMAKQNYVNMEVYPDGKLVGAVVLEKGILKSIYSKASDEIWVNYSGTFVKESDGSYFKESDNGITEEMASLSISEILIRAVVENTYEYELNYSYSYGSTKEIIIIKVEFEILGISVELTEEVTLQNGLLKEVKFSGNDMFSGISASFTYSKNSKYYAPDNPADKPEVQDTIGILMPTEMYRFVKEGNIMKKEFEKAGYTVDLQFANNTSATQVTQLEDMIEKGVKAVIVCAIQPGSLNAALKQAKEKGILIIAYDRMLTNTTNLDYYVSFNNFEVGVAQGKYIEETLGLKNLEDGESKNIEFIAGDPGDPNALLFFNGAMSVLSPYLDSGKLVVPSGRTTFEQVATPQWDTQKAATYFANILETHGYVDDDHPIKLDAVCASNDSTAQGVTIALKNAGFTAENFPVITGQDCEKISFENIINGLQSMSIFKDTRILAARAAEMTLQALKGETVSVNESVNNDTKDVPTYFCELTVVTKENYWGILFGY